MIFLNSRVFLSNKAFLSNRASLNNKASLSNRFLEGKTCLLKTRQILWQEKKIQIMEVQNQLKFNIRDRVKKLISSSNNSREISVKITILKEVEFKCQVNIIMEVPNKIKI
jgi:hypothetical protein